MFERFTDRARATVKGAVAEAQDMRDPSVGTEHLLLAMLDERPGGVGGDVAGQVLRDAGVTEGDIRARVRSHASREALGEADAAALRQIGIDLEAVRAKIEQNFGEGALRPARQRRRGFFSRRLAYDDSGRFSPGAKKALELSLREAIRLKDRHIGTEHLLLGLLREGDGLGVRVLTEAGVSVDDLRERLIAAMRAAA